MEGPRSLRRNGSLSSWIYAITRNRCLTALEKRWSPDSLEELGEEAEFGSPATGQPDDGRAEQLLGLVELLPERLRRALVLHWGGIALGWGWCFWTLCAPCCAAGPERVVTAAQTAPSWRRDPGLVA
jgi:hypothetical protein